MLTYSFTNLKNESLYMHLYQCIRQDIVDGKLVSGEKLPSKRSFAKNLGLSTITIENAYAQLFQQPDTSGKLSIFYLGKIDA